MTSGGMTLWFTGLPGAGKTTLGHRVACKLSEQGFRVEVLDGDLIRAAISPDLGYTKQERDAHVRRVGFISHLLSRNGVVAIAAVISPYRQVRAEIRKKHQGTPFVEIFVDCSLDVLIKRDVKGLYKRALKGELQNFTGVSDPYEAPENPEIVVHTDRQTPDETVGEIFAALRRMGLVQG